MNEWLSQYNIRFGLYYTETCVWKEKYCISVHKLCIGITYLIIFNTLYYKFFVH